MQINKEKLISICDRIIEFCIYGFVFFLPISNALIEVFVGWAIFALLVKKITQRKLPKTPLNSFIGLYFLALLVSAIFSSDVNRSLYTIFAKILHYVAFYFAVIEVATNRKILRNSIVVLSFSLLLICVDGIQQYFTFIDFIRHRKWPWISGADRVIGRISACFTSPNGLAAYLVPMGILVSSLSAIVKKFYLKITFLIVFLLSATCLLLTVTRSAYFAFGITLVFMAVLSKKKSRYVGLILAFLLAAVIMKFFSDLFKYRLSNFMNILDTGSFDRKLLWQMSWNMFKDASLWGQGIGTFMQNFSKYTLFPASKQLSYAHNSYLQLLAEAGILGLGSFLAIIFVTLYKSIKKYLSSDREGFNTIHLGFISALIAFLIHAFFDNHFYSLTFSLLFWFLVGVNMSFVSNHHD